VGEPWSHSDLLIIDDESSVFTIVIVLKRSGKDAPENIECHVEEDPKL
jgi:hypothetical protein